jgi:hypothetical protein
MALFEITCTNAACATKLKIDTATWGDEDIVSVYCPNCKKLLKKYFNPKKKAAAQSQPSPPKKTDPGTVVISRLPAANEKNSHTAQGWLVQLRAPHTCYHLTEGRQTVGRSSSSKKSDVSLETTDSFISGAHCIIEIARRANSITAFISDNESANGVWLNRSKHLAPNEIIYLTDGTIVGLGKTEFVFVSGNEISSPAEALAWSRRFFTP